jgi:hypothetical protein
LLCCLLPDVERLPYRQRLSRFGLHHP